MTITVEQIADYRERGFVRLPKAVDDVQLDVLMAALRDLGQEHRAADRPWSGPWRNAYENGAAFTLQTIGALAKKSDIWNAWLTSPGMLLLAGALSGVPMRHTDAMLIVKPPETGQAFPPHQDGAYYANNQANYTIITLHLHDTNTENGAVRYLPGSHRQGLLPHDRQDSKAWLPDVNMDDLIEVHAGAGDLVCSNIYTIHASLPNRSASPRALVRIGYRPV